MHVRSLLVLGAAAALTFTSTAAFAQGRTVKVTASEYTFDAPDSLEAGTITFTLVDRGRELHHVQIVRLQQGKTMADLAEALKTQGPPPAWVEFLGGPNSPVPDGSSMTTLTVTLSAGNYALMCFIPGPDGQPHAMKGMVHPLTVWGKGGVMQAGSPKPDVVLTLADYNFDLDKPLTAGHRTIRIVNTSQQPHEAFLVKLPPNTPVTALMGWLEKGMQGPPPVMPAGGITGLAPGHENLLTVDLQAGEYGLYCFWLDAKDGQEHVKHGMFKQLTVK